MKKLLSVLLCLAMVATLAPMFFLFVGNVQAISKFGVEVIGGPPKLGTFVGPTWLTSEGNRVYVVDETAFRIQVIQKGGAPIFSYGIYGFHEEQIAEPGGVVAYREKIYWLDRANGKIIVKPNKMESPIEGELSLLDIITGKRLLRNANGICADSGKLFIANTGDGNVIVCDTTGKYVTTIGTKGTGEGQMLSPTGVVVASGKLYVTDPQAGKIFIYETDGKFVSSFPAGHPYAITAIEARLFVTDNVLGKVTVYGPDGTTITSFGTPGSGIGQLNDPRGITVLDGKVYVSSFYNNRVDMFEPDGKHIGVFGLPVEQAAASFGRPTGMAIYGDNLYISDQARNKVITYNKDGKYVSEFGSYGSGDKQFANPTGIAADTSGNLYVADTGNNTVKVFGPDGSYKRTIGSEGNGNGKLYSPADVAVAASVGKVFVSDSGNNLIQVFSLSGEFLTQFGGFGNAPGQFNNPMGIATDGRKLIVADSANCRIQELTLDGKPVRSYGHRGRGKDQLFFPTDCSFDASGKIYVADTYNNRLVAFDNASKRSWIYGRFGGPGKAMYFSKSGEENENPEDPDIKLAAGFFTYPGAVVCNDKGIIVADTSNSRLQSIPYESMFRFPRIDTETFIDQPDQTIYFTVAPKILDFGVVQVGETAQKKVEIRNWTGGVLSGHISIIQDSPFASIDSQDFVGDVTVITVKVDTQGMTAGQAMKAQLKIQTNKGDQTIEVMVLPSDGYGFTLSPENNLFVEMECNNPASLEIAVSPQNGFDKTVNLSYAMPPKRCVLPPGKVVEGVDCKGYELTTLTVEFKPSTIRVKENNKATMTLVPKGNVIPGIYEISIIMTASGAANKEVKFTFVLLVNPCNNPVTDKLVPRNLLTETFTAVWCQYCPFHREAQYRMFEEYGPAEIIPLAYYADAPGDNSGMTQESHHYRYKWYTAEGLPTTMFNGLNNFSEGDKPFERQNPPPDRLPDRRMSGTSFSYYRFKNMTEKNRYSTSPIQLFLQANVEGHEGDAYLEVNTLGDISGFKDLNAYFVLVENNVLFAATNGENEHSLTVMKFLEEKGAKKSAKDLALGDPISLQEGTTTRRSMHFEMPALTYDWKTLIKHCYVVAWIQDNTKKEILQSTMVDLAEPLLTRYSFRKINGQSSGVQAGSRANFKYILTNLGNFGSNFKVDLSHIGGQLWENQLLVDKVPIQQGTSIYLDPMQSSLLEFAVEVPPDTVEGTESQYRLDVSETAKGDVRSANLKLLIEPAKPPSFELTSATKFVEVEPGGENTFNVVVQPINEYNNPVTLELSKESSKFFTATFDPPNGVPPFECKVTLKTSDQLEYFEDGYKLKIMGVGSDAKGDRIEKDIITKAQAKTFSLSLKPERKIITSCAINEICRQTEIKVMLDGSIPVKGVRFDFVYDERYLEVTNVSLGNLMTRYGEIPQFTHDIRPDRVVVRIQREKAVSADMSENIVAAITLKAAGDKIEIDNVRIGLENVTITGSKGNKMLVTVRDDSLSIRKNAKPPVIHMLTPIQKDSPWPTVEESKRREDQKLINYFDLRTKERSLLISGKCESLEGVSQLTLFVSGQKVAMNADGSFEYNMNLKEGYNNIVVVCQNFTGESDGILVVVVLDTMPPDLAVDKPDERFLGLDYSLTTNESFMEFHGYTEANAVIKIGGKQVQIRRDAFTEDESKRWFFFEKIMLSPGLNEIEVSACDDMDNCRSITYKITFEPKKAEKIVIQLWVGKKTMKVNGVDQVLVAAPTLSSPPLPKVLAGSTFMPIAEVARALGVQVGWDGKERKVTLMQTLTGGKTKVIELWIGKRIAKIDDKDTLIDQTKNLYPWIVEGKTMLPLRFVSEALGCSVDYESKEKKITVTYPK